MSQMERYEYGTKPAAFSIPSILAIVAAIIAFFVGPGLGLALAIIAIILGAVGLLIALMPNVRGGVISVVSVILGVIGILIAIGRLVV